MAFVGSKPNKGDRRSTISDVEGWTCQPCGKPIRRGEPSRPYSPGPVEGPEPVAVNTHEIVIPLEAVVRSLWDDQGNPWITISDLDRSDRDPARFGFDDIWTTPAGDTIAIGPALAEWLAERTERPPT